VIVAASDAGGEKDGGTAQPTVTVTPSAAGNSSGRTVVIPASCEQGLERARTALSTVGDAVDAARNLNTARLQELLDDLQDAQRDVERLAGQCRSAVPDRHRP
jgi:hypothetical protein